jgi:hypothetical protein
MEDLESLRRRLHVEIPEGRSRFAASMEWLIRQQAEDKFSDISSDMMKCLIIKIVDEKGHLGNNALINEIVEAAESYSGIAAMGGFVL